MKISKLLTAVFALVAFLAISNAAYAQETATVQATGTVLEPISFTNSTNLDFGTSIFPGIDEVIAITDAGAAQFDIDGETSKEVNLTFTIPSDLIHDSDGTTTMPISFSTSDAGHNTGSDPSMATTFDPSTTATTNLGGTSGLLYVWLGGTVSPASNQKAGAYSEDIVLEVAYTGN